MISQHRLRAIAVKSETDPRTVLRKLKGLPVRQSLAERIERAMSDLGISENGETAA